MTNSLNKSLKRIQSSLEDNQLSQSLIKEVISLFLSDVVETLMEDKNYNIPNFGSFYCVTYPAKNGVDPIKKQPYSTVEHNVPKFKFAKKVKKVVASSEIKPIESTL